MNLTSVFGRKGASLYKTAFFGYIPEFTDKSDEVNSKTLTPKFIDLCQGYIDGVLSQEVFNKGLAIIFSHCSDELWKYFYGYLTGSYPVRIKQPEFTESEPTNYIQPVYNENYALCKISNKKSRIFPYSTINAELVGRVNQNINRFLVDTDIVDIELLGYLELDRFVVHDININNPISTRMKMKDLFSYSESVFDVVETYQITDNRDHVLRLLVEQFYEAYLTYEMTSNRTFHWKLNKLKGTSL